MIVVLWIKIKKVGNPGINCTFDTVKLDYVIFKPHTFLSTFWGQSHKLKN